MNGTELLHFSWSLCIGAEVAVQTAAGAGPATRVVHRAASILLITSRVIGNRISRGKTRAAIGSDHPYVVVGAAKGYL